MVLLCNRGKSLPVIKFLDLTKNYEQRAYLLAAVDKVLQHGKLVLGPEVVEFENKISSYCGRKFAVGVGSGTDALFIALRALGIGPGDEVITTSMSWIATANAIAMTGATPMFADIDVDLNIDPSSVKKLITEKTKCILIVNFTGQMVKINLLNQIAIENNIHLVEDGSQSFGAEFKGKKSGSFGVISTFSHNPMKIFGGIGEAGSILTDDKEIYNSVMCLRYNGTVDREVCVTPSLNGRIDTIQASILLKEFENFEDEIKNRRKNAKIYDILLKGIVETPIVHNKDGHIFYTYTIRTEKRDELKDFLEVNGIETRIQHKIPMPMQSAYLSSKGEWGNALQLASKILCLPIHSKLTDDDISFISENIQTFFNK